MAKSGKSLLVFHKTRLSIVTMNDYRHFATGPYSRGDIETSKHMRMDLAKEMFKKFANCQTLWLLLAIVCVFGCAVGTSLLIIGCGMHHRELVCSLHGEDSNVTALGLSPDVILRAVFGFVVVTCIGVPVTSRDSRGDDHVIQVHVTGRIYAEEQNDRTSVWAADSVKTEDTKRLLPYSSSIVCSSNISNK